MNVKQLGVNTAGAAITVTGGPNNMTVSGGPTDASGNATVSVPGGTGYTVTATKAGQSANATAAVTVGSTTNVALSLPNPPTGTLDVNVTQLSLAASGATVTVTGGPWSISQTLTTGASGQVTFPAVPGGTGYTVTATKGSDTANVTTSVTAGSTTTANVALPNPPAGSVQATVTWLAALQSGATVQITGGPYSISASGGPTHGNRHRHVHERPVRYGLHRHGDEERPEQERHRGGCDHGLDDERCDRDADGTINTTVTWLGQLVGILPVPGTVTITGGPTRRYLHRVDQRSRRRLAITVPATTAAYPYTVSARKFSGATWSSNTVNAASTITSLRTVQPRHPPSRSRPRRSSPSRSGAAARSASRRESVRISQSASRVARTAAPAQQRCTSTSPVATNGSSKVTTTITVPAIASGALATYTVKVWVCVPDLSGTTNRSPRARR